MLVVMVASVDAIDSLALGGWIGARVVLTGEQVQPSSIGAKFAD